MNKLDLQNYVAQNPGLVTVRESISSPGVFVLKYKKKVFFKGLWNEYLEECRGTLVDSDYNVVSRPFTKIYNYGVEASCPKFSDDTPITAHRKINGFMGAITWHDGALLVSTTGSTDSPFVAYINEMIADNYEAYENVCADHDTLTFLFEVVHPDDPHIVPEEVGMYLLGYREKTWESTIETELNKVFENMLGTIPVETHRTTLGELLEDVKHVHHEGFVFYTDDGIGAKIKSPFYLASKFVSRNPNTEKLFKQNAKEILDEEYHVMLDSIQENIVEFTALSEQDRLLWVRKYLGAE